MKRALKTAHGPQLVYLICLKVIFNAARDYHNDEENDVILEKISRQI